MSNKIGGSGNKSGGYTPYTGLASVKVLMVNPTNEDYERVTGSAFPVDLKYDPIVGADGKKEKQLLNFLVHEESTNTFAFLPIFLSKLDVATKDGKKFKFIDKLGQISYYIDDPKNISSKFKFDESTAVKLKQGQESLTVLLQRLFGYKSSAKGANWMADIKNSKADAATLFQGQVGGINTLLKDAYESDYSIVVLFSVREKDGKYYQSIENNPELIWSNQGSEIPNFCYKAMKERQDEQAKAGYPLSKNLYTFKFQPFTLEECANYHPSDDSEEVNGAEVEGSSLSGFEVSHKAASLDFPEDDDDPFKVSTDEEDTDWLGN
jgi:hypothetical protein